MNALNSDLCSELQLHSSPNVWKEFSIYGGKICVLVCSALLRGMLSLVAMVAELSSAGQICNCLLRRYSVLQVEGNEFWLARVSEIEIIKPDWLAN